MKKRGAFIGYCKVALMAFIVSKGCITPWNLNWEKGRTLMSCAGRVNTWAQGEKNLEKDIAVMREENVDGYMIEMMGWARYDAWTPEWMKQTEDQYKTLLDLCRKKRKMAVCLHRQRQHGVSKVWRSWGQTFTSHATGSTALSNR